MEKRISVVIPNYNGSSTIAACLEAVLSSRHNSFEIIIVDDCSSDNSVEVISQYPCRLIRLDRRSGASRARNTGAYNSQGEVLFFIDADCIVLEDTLSVADRTIGDDNNTVFGGTYTVLPYDNSFFSTFQSVFINHSETRNEVPDYIASHALVISRDLFSKSGGFPEDFLPILEDVEFSHRLRRSGVRLRMNPELLVRHVFNFTLSRSLRNAYRKSLWWTIYSLRSRDLLSDSGTASAELKTDVVSFFISTVLVLAALYMQSIIVALPILPLFAINLIISRRLLAAFHKTKGRAFLISAIFYYTLVYPLAVCAGSSQGMLKYFWSVLKRRKAA